MTDIAASTVVEAMNWRYAAKTFDRTKKISDADRTEFLEALRLSPFSYGLQPWKFIARRRSTTSDHITRHVEMLQQERGVSAEALQSFKNMLIRSAAGRPPELQDAWNSNQTDVALGVAATAAALLKIDACPVEGVDPVKFDDVLGLSGGDFTTTVAIAFGDRGEHDLFSSFPPLSRAADDVFVELGAGGL
ncbi:MAG: nitroreductase family protein [Pseudomonadota bacterium]